MCQVPVARSRTTSWEKKLLMDGNLNSSIPVERIREFIWYSETGAPLDHRNVDAHPYFLGKNSDTSYFFAYEPDRGIVLDRDTLASIPRDCAANGYVFYVDACALSDKSLQAMSIVFKKIPRDIARI